MRLASVDSYLPDAGDLSQACIPLGFFTAFCLQHQLHCFYQKRQNWVKALFCALDKISLILEV